MRESPVDLVIADVILPGMDGVEAIKIMRRDFPDVRIIAISGGGNFGLNSYLPKRFRRTPTWLPARRRARTEHWRSVRNRRVAGADPSSAERLTLRGARAPLSPYVRSPISEHVLADHDLIRVLQDMRFTNSIDGNAIDAPQVLDGGHGSTVTI